MLVIEPEKYQRVSEKIYDKIYTEIGSCLSNVTTHLISTVFRGTDSPIRDIINITLQHRAVYNTLRNSI